MKQNELAELAGVTSAYISQIVNGKRKVKWEIAKKIGAALGIDPSRIMDGIPQDSFKLIIEETEKNGNRNLCSNVGSATSCDG